LQMPFLAGFRRGLMETGYIEGQNVTIEYRTAGLQFDRLPALADELVRRRVAVIVATGGIQAPAAAVAATKTIPIVFIGGVDPLRLGLGRRPDHPGGDLTRVRLPRKPPGGEGLPPAARAAPHPTP